MTKDLSRQLCEQCGIAPKIRYFLKFMDVEYETTKEDIAARSEIFKTGVLKITKVVRDYPDFTKPENFVRLLELKPYGARTIFYIVTKTVAVQHLTGIYNRNDFIFCLKGCLDESIKQAIREAEWAYED